MKSALLLIALVTSSYASAGQSQSKAAEQLGLFTDLVGYAKFPAPDCVVTTIPITVDDVVNQTSSPLVFSDSIDKKSRATSKTASVVVGNSMVTLEYRPDLTLSSDFMNEPRGMIVLKTWTDGLLNNTSYVQLGKLRVEIGNKAIICVK